MNMLQLGTGAWAQACCIRVGQNDQPMPSFDPSTQPGRCELEATGEPVGSTNCTPKFMPLSEDFEDRTGAGRAFNFHTPTISSTPTNATRTTEVKAAISEAMAASLLAPCFIPRTPDEDLTEPTDPRRRWRLQVQVPQTSHSWRSVIRWGATRRSGPARYLDNPNFPCPSQVVRSSWR